MNRNQSKDITKPKVIPQAADAGMTARGGGEQLLFFQVMVEQWFKEATTGTRTRPPKSFFCANVAAALNLPEWREPGRWELLGDAEKASRTLLRHFARARLKDQTFIDNPRTGKNSWEWIKDVVEKNKVSRNHY